ncbi:hypothetical protein BH11BAC2_BH11BAC2_06480 [soil metagenome]
MNLNRILFLPATALLMFTLGCSPSKKATSTKTPVNPQAETQQVATTYAYFNAIKEKLTGNPEKAAEQFATVLRSDPKNHAAMYELASIYSDQKKYNDALFFAKSAYELNPSNEWYSLLLADTYEKTGKYAESVTIYQKLIKAHPDRVDYYFSEADAFLYQGKYTDAISTYNQVEKIIGVSRELSIQKQRLYLKQGKVDEAAAELELLIKSDPDNLDNYSLLVELYQVNEKKDKAMEVIHRMEAIDPDNPGVALSLAEYYRSNGQKTESFEQLKKAFRSNQLSSDVKIRILTSYLPLATQSEDMMIQSLELSKILSEIHPTEANPQAVYGDFLTIGKQFEPARKQYRTSIGLDKKNLNAWQQLLLVESELRDYKAMESESDEAISLFADQSVLYLFNGLAKEQNKKPGEAAISLLSGSKLVVDNDAQLLDFYSNLGSVYNTLKKFQESDLYYGKALKLDPNNIGVLNNWAYFLSLRKDQLETAADMSRKSNDLDPGNPSYEDTFGWILYIQGKYDDAKTWMEKALQSGGNNNGTILEHYGDVLFRLGKTEDALSNWQKAKASGDYSEFLDKKIADKKLYE